MKIAIVGGGLLGLCIGYFLQKITGAKIIIVEKEKELGGACSWREIGGTIVDRFYHVIMAEDGRIFRFMDELGLQGKYGFATSRMGIFDGARINPISTPKDFFLYPNLSVVDKWRLAYTVCYSRFFDDWSQIESRSASEWLISVGGKKNYELMWQPIMRAKFGDSVHKMTAVDMHARIRRFSISRKSDFSQTMAYISGTPKTLIDVLEQRLRDRGTAITKGNGVKVIDSRNGEISGLILENGELIQADQYFFTVSIPDFVTMVPDLFSEYKEQLRQVQYLDNVSLILKLSKPLTPYYMLNVQDAKVPFTGLIGLSHIYPPDEFGGDSIFYASKYLFAGQEFYLKDKEEVLSLFLPHLKRINPDFSESWIKGCKLSKGKNIEPFHGINYSKLIPSKRTPFKNASLVTTAQIYPDSTVMNASVRVAEEVAHEFFKNYGHN